MKTLREIILYSNKYKYTSFYFLAIIPTDLIKNKYQILDSVYHEPLKYKLISFLYLQTLLILSGSYQDDKTVIIMEVPCGIFRRVHKIAESDY